MGHTSALLVLLLALSLGTSGGLTSTNVEGTCVNGTLWDGVMSVENATVWQRAMNATGLRLVLESPESRGDAVFVVRDNDVLNCEDGSVSECRQVELQWQLQLNSRDAVGLLLLNWIPSYRDLVETVSLNGTSLPTEPVVVESKLKEAAERNKTTREQVWSVEVVFSDVGDLNLSSLSVVGNNSSVVVGEVRLVDGQEARNGRLGGVPRAKVTDVVEVCDGGGTVYVLDDVLFPDLLPETNVTELPLLDGRCWENFMTLAKKTGANFPYVLLATFANPIVSEVLDPASNITLFVPSFEGNLDPSFFVISATSTPDKVGETPVLLLSHAVRGGYCPEELDGQSIQSLAGELTGQNFPLTFVADPTNPNKLKLIPEFGDRDLAFDVEYVGTACHSAMYSLRGFVTPWTRESQPSLLSQNDLARIPKVSSDDDLFNLPDICAPSNSSMLATPPLSSADTSTSGDSLSGGEIAGIVVGCVAGFGLALLALLFIATKRGAKTGPLLPSTWYKDTKSQSTVDLLTPIPSESVDLPWDDLVLKPEDIVFDVVPETQERVLLGAGRFGKVYSASLFGSERVAVKCIQPTELHSAVQQSSSSSGQMDGRDLVPKVCDHSPPEVVDSAQATTTRSSLSVVPKSSASQPSKQVLREIALLKACRSQHVVSFMGACFLDGEVQLVTELMPAGDLWSALRAGHVSWSGCGPQIAMDVASGLSYLHSRRVIHLDLKSSNILLRWSGGPDESNGSDAASTNHGMQEHSVHLNRYQAKVSDVGLARILPDSREYISSLGGVGTWNWCAPEVILSQKCTSAADMWSFGVILWELCTQEIPVRGRMRLVRVPEECPQEIADLIDQCSKVNPSDRPTAVEALRILQKQPPHS